MEKIIFLFFSFLITRAMDIRESKFLIFLVLILLAVFGAPLVIALIVFYGLNAINKVKRRKIWATYGMCMLGAIIGAIVMEWIMYAIPVAVAFAVIGYYISGKVKA